MIISSMVEVLGYILGFDEGTELGSSDGSFDDSNNVTFEGSWL